MNIRGKFKQKFLTPSGNVSRVLNVVMLLIASIGAFFAFYVVKFIPCIKDNCTESSLGNLINTLSPFFIGYGLCCIVMANFIRRNKNIFSLYADSVTILSIIGVMFIILLVFSVK